jgi:hypothetical protein
MSAIHDKLKSIPRGQEAKPEWYDEMYERMPNVADILAGSPAGADNQPAIAPMTLMLSSYQGRLQFSFGVRNGKEMWTGDVMSASSVLEAVELAIAAGELRHIPIGKR